MTLKSNLKGTRFIYLAVFLLNILVLGFQFYKSKDNGAAHKGFKELDSDGKSVTLFFSRNIEQRLDTILDSDMSKTLLLRFVKNDCHECVDSIFNNTIRLSRAFGKEGVVVLINGDYSFDEYLRFKRLYQYDLKKIYYMPNKLTSLDDGGNSYYFIVTKDSISLAQKIYQIQKTEDAGNTPLYNEWVKKL